MGPRSENRGYGLAVRIGVQEVLALQWVHGRRTVVMSAYWGRTPATFWLQWVHGRRTVVMLGNFQVTPPQALVKLQWVHGRRTVVMARGIEEREAVSSASMGPRSENRGYGPSAAPSIPRRAGFNGSTVGEPWLWPLRASGCTEWMPSFNGSTVGEPWLCTMLKAKLLAELLLQWVHGRRTVVMDHEGRQRRQPDRVASMGPRSENRGYGIRSE